MPEHPVEGGKDLWSGLFLLGVGLGFSLYGWREYPMGALADMGPGMFPVMLGLLLDAIGGFMVLSALMRGQFARLGADWRALLPITAGIVMFILTIERFGVAVAVISLTWLASLAGHRLTLGRSVLLGVVLTLAVMLIFVYGLGIPVQLFAWNL